MVEDIEVEKIALLLVFLFSAKYRTDDEAN